MGRTAQSEMEKHNKKVYFVSDFHLGSPTYADSRRREEKIVAWLDHIKPTAEALYLVGDVFDFWYEYKFVVPKGYVRLLGRLAQWRDEGIPVYMYTGNHDLWMFDYFEKELDIPVRHQPTQELIHGKHFFIGHGDGLGPKDHSYKILKRVFTNRFLQWAFMWVHPDVGARFAAWCSRRSRAAQKETERFLGEDNEWLYLYANRKLDALPQTHYFVFGHRHLPLDMALKNGQSRYINLGEWFNACTFAEFDGQELVLRQWKDGKVLTYEQDNLPAARLG